MNQKSKLWANTKAFLCFLVDPNHFAILLFVAILVTLMIVGCDEAPPNQSATPPKQEEKPNSPIGFKASIEALPKPNEYQVRVTWNSGDGNWKIYRKDSQALLKELGTGRGEYVDLSARPGERYSYILAGLESSGLVFKASADVSIPRDLEIKETITLATISAYNRLFLSKGSRLMTNGQTATIEVNEILSNEGSIETFDRMEKAASGAATRSGGFIKIIANRASGRLLVAARGENGADGSDGANGANGTPGHQGQPGRWGVNPELVKALGSQDGLAGPVKNQQRLNPPPGKDWEGVWTNGMRWWVCASPPTNGSPGGDGTPGRDGADGSAGGNSAKTYIEIRNESPFSTDVIAEPGAGGYGGRGGFGGKGAPGGPPGELDRGHLCPSANQGPAGKDAVNGRQGRPGQQGSKQPICIKVSTQVTGQCEKF